MRAKNIGYEYASVVRDIKENTAQRERLNSRLRQLKSEFMIWSEAQGADTMVTDHITIRKSPRVAASIVDGGSWSDFMAWVVLNGSTDLISYKRPNAKALQEMIMAGEAIPDYIEITEYDEVTYSIAKNP